MKSESHTGRWDKEQAAALVKRNEERIQAAKESLGTAYLCHEDNKIQQQQPHPHPPQVELPFTVKAPDGSTMTLFTYEFTAPGNAGVFCGYLYAKDWRDAERRMEALKHTARVVGVMTYSGPKEKI